MIKFCKEQCLIFIFTSSLKILMCGGKDLARKRNKTKVAYRKVVESVINFFSVRKQMELTSKFWGLMSR